jgi:DNA polymerase/3'-5' exonuclease PolX
MATLKTKMSYAEAKDLTERLITRLAPACARLEIAGSVRRKKPEVGDLELVVIPQTENIVDMFGSLFKLDAAIPGQLIKGGNNYRKYDLGPITLDLFLTTPEKWGCIFTIRTGSAEFSHRLVTARKFGGLCPSNLKFKDGRIWDGDTTLETPEEADVFKALHMYWIEPEKRI